MNNSNLPKSSLQTRKSNEQIIKDYDEAKKLEERYNSLKRRLETCREVKTNNVESIKDRRAISYFETCQGQIQLKLTQHEENYKKVIEQMENAKRVLEEKLLFVNQRLDQAKERTENQTRHKSKEEIGIEKEIQEIIPKYSELQPNCNLNQVFPDYKKLLNLPETTPSQPVYTSSTNIPNQTPSTTPTYSKAKRKAKVVEVEEAPVLPDPIPEPKRDENPLAMMSDKDIAKLSQAEMWKYLHPNKPLPPHLEEEQEEQPEEEEEEPAPRFQYPKIVSNSKLPLKAKRVPKA